MKKSITKLDSKKVINTKAVKGGHPGKGYSRPQKVYYTIEGHVTILK